MNKHKLCLVGFGNVGRAFVRLLQDKTVDLRERYGIEWCITGVATRRLGWLVDPNGLDVAALFAGSLPPEPASRRLRTVREWLEAAQADVLLEVSSLNPQTGQPAIEHLRAALDMERMPSQPTKVRWFMPTQHCANWQQCKGGASYSRRPSWEGHRSFPSSVRRFRQPGCGDFALYSTRRPA